MTTTADDDAAIPLEQHLEALQKDIIENCRFPNLSTVLAILHKHLASDFHANPCFGESNINSTSREQHFTNIITFLSANPDYRGHVVSQTSKIYPGLKLAVNYATVILSGFASDAATVFREAVIVFNWRSCEDGRWRIYEHSTMRGPGGGFQPFFGVA